ncbi:MAG: transcription-repair coupling factor, partial [Bifidobacteriaceae bacterium]|nr:transcription-repair coupling factor [Bifidobacteriaceae bacterium]
MDYKKRDIRDAFEHFSVQKVLRPYFFNKLSTNHPIAIIVPNSEEAEKGEYILQNLNNFFEKTGDKTLKKSIGYFQDNENMNINDIKISKYNLAHNFRIASELKNLDIVFLPFRYALFPINEKMLKSASDMVLELKSGSAYNFDNILSKLVDAGYSRIDLVDSPGTFAVRGSIIDICEAQSGQAFRLDFFGDELETIRQFDIFSQLSEKEMKRINIFPIASIVKDSRTKNDKSVLEFVSATHNILIPDFYLILSKANDSEDLANYYLEGDDFENHYFKWSLLLESLKSKIATVDSFSDAKVQLNYDDALLHFLERVPDTFVANREKAVRQKANINPIELEAGQILVHERYGIGKYLGLAKRYIDKGSGKYQEYIEIEYAPSSKLNEPDKLLISTDNLSQITKYIGHDNPKLSRLGSGHWKKARRDARKLARQITENLISLYSKRLGTNGFAFGPDSAEQKDFDADFLFAETPDQLKTIQDVKEDMESIHPMDRLICGDVGYGKTEIMFRAAFKAVDNAKQVAILVPTTLLVSQHFETAKKRFENTPFRIEYLSRFQSAKKAKQIIEDAKAGKVDILIGTHKLLSDKIDFYALGLVVIDEEQRFGVKQKEKLKAKNPAVDILSLSATPIPRTLEMALTGIKQLSMLITPPLNRQPIITRVAPKSINLISAAIKSEILRGGQVFFVHNNIETIEKVHLQLKENLDKSIRIGIAHGKTEKNQLDKITYSFYTGAIDILLCTTIIETGIDIPNANTLIIDDAHKLGLVQLHQIRGRVGRSLTQSFCYLLYDNKAPLKENAYRRLETISENVKLGSGIAIAMKDLQIRGAGNFLGREQSGKIEGVGYDLYTKMVEEALQIYKTGKAEIQELTKLETDFNLHIPEFYINVQSLRLEIYRQIDLSNDDEKIQETKRQIVDRFGKYPKDLENLFYLQKIKNLASQKGISSIIVRKKKAIINNKDFQLRE